MLFQYPLETLVRRRTATSQIDFAREARRVLKDSEEALFEAHDHGLAIFAANEEALDAPIEILRGMYGDFVEVRRPRVRCVPGDPPQEPIMHVRITTRSDYVYLVLAELRAREVLELERCTRGRVEILRGEGPLAALLGFARTLAAITNRTAAHQMRLVRYEPIPAAPRPAA